MAEQKKEEEERIRKEESEKKAREAEEKRKRLEEAEKKRQGMVQAQKDKHQAGGYGSSDTRKGLGGVREFALISFIVNLFFSLQVSKMLSGR